MYSDLPLWLSLLFVVTGLVALTWSSGIFVDGSAALARRWGVSPFVIGMVIIGFGTSAPELCVSALSGIAGHADLSLGNAYGSDIFNIAVILGVAALIRPLVVKPTLVKFGAPLLVLVSILPVALVWDGRLSRLDAIVHLAVFAIVLPLYCWIDRSPAKESAEEEVPAPNHPLLLDLLMVAGGLAVLIGSSHFLVWGAVDLARVCGVSELLIGLTIVAIGTSLPELASAIQSARRGQDEFVLGNIVGSNFFNSLAVVGLSCVINPPAKFSPYILTRDLPLMIALSASIALFGFNRRNPSANGTVTRKEAVVWILAYIAYAGVMLVQESGTGVAAP
ncbi:MAG TPA: calcium/sodium antiporter [Verrucomicrobia bacterium]|nr:calcium/sodium antiporter [Verrucomicrobiota bacterium]HCG19485.1 calcium/sodium antiporter [Verrucomicrobiota bacterium]